MAIRCLLHKSKLEEFKSWMDSQGIEWRDSRGVFQVIQVRSADGKGWDVIYEKNNSTEHYTVPEPMIKLVRRFIDESRDPI